MPGDTIQLHEPDPIWRILRHVEGRSLVWLAERTGWSYRTVRAYSCGYRRPSRRFCEAAAGVLGYRTKELFRDVRQHTNRGVPPAYIRRQQKESKDEATSDGQTEI